MPYLGPGAGPTAPDVIADEQGRAEAVHEAEMEDDYDEMRDEASAVGRGRWFVILLIGLGILALVVLLYEGLLFFQWP